MPVKLRNIFKNPIKLSLKQKMILSLSAIAVILLTSSIISVIEYKIMSTYVSVIGDDDLSSLPDFNQQEFVSHCDSLRNSFADVRKVRLADSVLYAWSAYMLTSLELPEVLKSDFIDSRTWYFDRLQPRYNRLNAAIDRMSGEIYSDLKKNSSNFDSGFYRSIVPGIVAVGVGLLLVLMLLFFILSYYVNPIYKMVDGLENFRSYNKRYNYTFDGDDQLSELNRGISELTEENRELRRRLVNLRNAKQSGDAPEE